MKTNLQKIVLDPFCLRQFDKTKTKAYINYDMAAFTSIVDNFYKEGGNLMDGYAPFCKHLFIPNFTDCSPGCVEITPENEKLIKTCYEARTEKELPVLKRYIEYDDVKQLLKPAIYLDIILYSKEQIQKEDEAMANENPNALVEYDYGIISVKPQDSDYELPMDPITMMRNALGKEHGGSGVELKKENYLSSVSFWTKNVLLK